MVMMHGGERDLFKATAMSDRLYFITGGARSGKSAFAEKIACGLSGKRAYIATAQALDPEMAARIAKHQRSRDGSWDTFEEPIAVDELLQKLSGRYHVALLDCLTLWLSNVMEHSDEDAFLTRCDRLVSSAGKFAGSCIIVSNEVGLGIVPDNPLARRFRDLAGTLNQKMAQAADEVFFIASGIPLKIK